MAQGSRLKFWASHATMQGATASAVGHCLAFTRSVLHSLIMSWPSYSIITTIPFLAAVSSKSTSVSKERIFLGEDRFTVGLLAFPQRATYSGQQAAAKQPCNGDMFTPEMLGFHLHSTYMHAIFPGTRARQGVNQAVWFCPEATRSTDWNRHSHPPLLLLSLPN